MTLDSMCGVGSSRQYLGLEVKSCPRIEDISVLDQNYHECLTCTNGAGLELPVTKIVLELGRIK